MPVSVRNLRRSKSNLKDPWTYSDLKKAVPFLCRGCSLVHQRVRARGTFRVLVKAECHHLKVIAGGPLSLYLKREKRQEKTLGFGHEQRYVP